MSEWNMEDLYEHIFEMKDVQQHPDYHGFSYGLLFVEEGEPRACFYLDPGTDSRMRFVLERGRLEFCAIGIGETAIYYGYVTDGQYFYCEEQVYPPREDSSSSGENEEEA